MLNETELIARLMGGEESAVRELISCVGDRLLRTAYGMTGDLQTAEEVVQDTFLKTCRRLNTFKGDSSLETWMFRILINTARNRMRNGWIKRVINMDEGIVVNLPAPAGYNPEDEILGLEKRREVSGCLKRLPVKYREVMVLHYLEDLSVAEISRVLGQPVGTVKSRLSRGRERMKKFPEISGGDLE